MSPHTLPSLATDWSLPPLPDRLVSEEEFFAWYPPETKCEWVDGRIIVMSPMSRRHDRWQWWFRSWIDFYVSDHGLGAVVGPQYTVRIITRPSAREPDVVFVSQARLSILKNTRIDGPPDLILEVVSPDSVNRDWNEKRDEFERAGVAEYWVADPLRDVFQAWSLDAASGKYASLPEIDGRIASRVVPGLYFRPQWLLTEPITDVRRALEEINAARNNYGS